MVGFRVGLGFFRVSFRFLGLVLGSFAGWFRVYLGLV